jgi:hypothetical protein
MKKIMSLMLGMSLVIGAASYVFAQSTDTTKSTKKSTKTSTKTKKNTKTDTKS